MLIMLLYLFSFFLSCSDQTELFTKISQEEWDKTPVRSRQELMSQAQIIKMLLKRIDELEKIKSFNSALQYVLKPDCRNDLK